MSETLASSPIAVMGDWHGDQGWALGAIRSAAREGASVIVHVGDCGLDFPGTKRGRYEQRLSRVLADLEVELVVSPGNHDCLTNIDTIDVQEDGLIPWRSNIKVLPKGGRTLIAGLRVAGLGGAYSIDQAWRREGKDWWPDEEPTLEQAEQLIAGGPVDLLITHDVPAGVPVRSELELPADVIERADRTRVLLREVVDRLTPPYVFAGHWHQRVVHEIPHPGGRISRVNVLDCENSRAGNGVLIWPGAPPLRIEPLIIKRG